MSSQILLVESADCPGLVHAITGVLLRRGLNVVRNAEYVDRNLSRALRLVFEDRVFLSGRRTVIFD
ncbi:MAG: hypothetical protein ABJC89_03300 [Acidobacteriota bacterium]